MSRRYEIHAFTAEHVDASAELLADRHRRHRMSTRYLNPDFEHPAVTRELVSDLAEQTETSGAVVLSDGLALAYVLGSRRPDATWGPNAWIEAAGSAGTDPESIREAYAAVAGQWVEQGRTSHYVAVPASDQQELEAWFSLGFGKQHVHALRAPAERDYVPRLKPGLSVRRAVRDDIPVLAELDRMLPQHQEQAPVFSRLPELTIDQARTDIEEDFDDARYTTFVVENGGRVIGAAVCCSIDLSPGNSVLMRPRSAGLLGFASVAPDARGLGAGRALGETVLCWARDEGYASVGVDWRSTNLLANRTWLALGFEPSFFRLHRAIV